MGENDEELMSIEAVLKRVEISANWRANARTLPPLRRIAEAVLDDARKQRDQGEPAAAIELIKSVRGWEEDPRGWRIVGHCELQQERHAASIAAFERAKSLNMLEVAKDHVNQVTAYLKINAYDQALQNAKEAQRFAPAHIEPYYCLLSIYNRIKRFDELDATLQAMPCALLDDSVLCEGLKIDPDLKGVSPRIQVLKRKAD